MIGISLGGLLKPCRRVKDGLLNVVDILDSRQSSLTHRAWDFVLRASFVVVILGRRLWQIISDGPQVPE